MMSRHRRIGLFLGKFTIFHAGHQHVIDTALREVDHLIVLIYDARSSTPIPLDVRARWIERICAGAPVEVIKGWCGPEHTGYSDEIIQLQNDYITGLVGDRGITHFYSSEPYGEHVSKALQCANRLVDVDRRAHPISASAIQRDPYTYRRYVHPTVYADLITNVVFVGAPSTGKTTIAKRLSAEYNTVWMPEYGRDYWMEHQVDKRLSPEQLVEIAEGHLAREDQLLREANRFLFTDTNAITTYMFAIDYHGSAHTRLAQLATEAEHRYDIVFLCDDDIPYDDTWDRSGDVKRHAFQRMIKSDLLQRKIPFITLSGSLDERMRVAKKVLAGYEKWSSLGDMIAR